MKLFDITRDKTHPCFCLGCLVGKNESELAHAKYCHECHAVLDKDPAYKSNDYQSEDGLILFCEEKAYGVIDTLKTVCLSSEADILKFLEMASGNSAMWEQRY